MAHSGAPNPSGFDFSVFVQFFLVNTNGSPDMSKAAGDIFLTPDAVLTSLHRSFFFHSLDHLAAIFFFTIGSLFSFFF